MNNGYSYLVDWAVALEGRADVGGVLLLVDDEEDAESIAVEMRRKGHRVVVRAHPGRDPLAVALQSVPET